MFSTTQKSTIEFALNGKVAGKIASTALQVVRINRMANPSKNTKVPTIDDFNDLMAEIESRTEGKRFMSDAGIEQNVDAHTKLSTWIGFAEANELSPNIHGVLKYMLGNMQNDLYSETEIEQISKRTKVPAKTVEAQNVKEVRAKMAQFKEDAISALQIICDAL
jgi:hypothetical protein